MIIDTNVYRAFMDGESAVRQHILFSEHLLVPLVVAAELYKGFLGGSRPEENKIEWEKFMVATRAEIVCPALSTAERFAELAVYCRRHGRVLSDNDLWVAATALETGEPLLTLDKDFMVFDSYATLTVRMP